MKIRSFLGIAISSALRDRLSDLQEDLGPRLLGIRWVKPESIHLTLKFLGSIHPLQVEEVSAAINSVVQERKPFVCRVSGMGGFPDPQRPRVLWVGVEGAEADLLPLMLDIDEALESFGFSKDERAFQPHLTLARIKADSEGVGTLLEAAGFFGPPRDYGSLCVDRITLFQSDRNASGSVYRALSSMPLLGQ